MGPSRSENLWHTSCFDASNVFKNITEQQLADHPCTLEFFQTRGPDVPLPIGAHPARGTPKFEPGFFFAQSLCINALIKLCRFPALAMLVCFLRSFLYFVDLGDFCVFFDLEIAKLEGLREKFDFHFFTVNMTTDFPPGSNKHILQRTVSLYRNPGFSENFAEPPGRFSRFGRKAKHE